ncbi:isochorismatase family protein [Catelliglobosispora koreensis]|uniref:isochorismatase family protein n=1 Tax=Catelliglobosispora koreensis TaxID=129052 RepID=UPI0003707CA2|nr:isochorismatase family protein [Catelliglobosispora koreensis]
MTFDDTALVLVDLMPRIIGLPLAPHSGETVLRNAIRLADAFRERQRPVIAIRVDRPNVAEQPPGSELNEQIAERSDVIVVKHSWGAFYGTDLDAELRKRDIKRIVIAGIATNMGVESTARAADDHGYDVTFAEDAMSGLDGDAHRFAVEYVFAKLGTVTTTDALTG